MNSNTEELEGPEKKRARNEEMEVPENPPPETKENEDGNTNTNENEIPEMKWQLEMKDIKERIAHLRKSGDFTDCRIIVGDSECEMEYEAHRMILAMSSPKFEEMVLSAGRDESLRISNVDPRIFNLLLDYMYTDNVNIRSSEEASKIYKAAMAYEMPFLCELTARYMAKDMNFSNVWPILDFVAETQEPYLKEECNNFVKKNPSLVLKHENFVKVHRGVISNILDMDCFDVSEIDVVFAVDRWAEHQCALSGLTETISNKRDIIGPDLLRKLRYLAVPREEFVRKLAYSGEESKSLLTLEESYSILMNMSVPGSFPIPENLSVDNRSRKLAKLRCVRRIQQTPFVGGFGQTSFVPTHPPPSTFHAYGNVTHPPPAKSPVIGNKSPTMPSAPTLGSKSFILEIKVDTAIVLHGIQVPTLPFPIGHNAKTFIKKEYDESFVMNVQDQYGNSMIHTVVSAKVPFGSVIDLEFKNSVVLLKNINYKILICTKNSYILNRKLCTAEECHPVKFFFKDICKVTAVAPPSGTSFISTKDSSITKDAEYGFVNQIIYSLWM